MFLCCASCKLVGAHAVRRHAGFIRAVIYFSFYCACAHPLLKLFVGAAVSGNPGVCQFHTWSRSRGGRERTDTLKTQDRADLANADECKASARLERDAALSEVASLKQKLDDVALACAYKVADESEPVDSGLSSVSQGAGTNMAFGMKAETSAKPDARKWRGRYVGLLPCDVGSPSQPQTATEAALDDAAADKLSETHGLPETYLFIANSNGAAADRRSEADRPLEADFLPTSFIGTATDGGVFLPNCHGAAAVRLSTADGPSGV